MGVRKSAPATPSSDANACRVGRREISSSGAGDTPEFYLFEHTEPYGTL